MSRIASLGHHLSSRAVIALLVIVSIADHGASAVRAIVPGDGGEPAAVRAVAVTNAFTFQGRLSGDGIPPTGSFDFEFRLFDNGTTGSGSPLGSGVVTKNDLQVTNGLFSTPLDFGPTAFNGDARWVEVSVRDGASTGAYTTLPRQELTATPYALVALNFAAHDHLGADWIGSDPNAPGLSIRNLDTNGTALYTEAGRIGLQAAVSSSGSYGIWGQSDGTNGTGVRGSGPTGVLAEGQSRGVSAFASQAGGIAVRGEAGAGNGVVGLTNTTGYAATVGINTGTQCNSGGFDTPTQNCVGIYGEANGATLTMGVAGIAQTTGVFGTASGSFGRGVRGVASGDDGVGVYGYSSHSTCTASIFAGIECAGVAGSSASAGGLGVGGQGGKFGVWGEPDINVVDGIGIYGRAKTNQWAGYFEGKVHATGAITQNSDARLKTNIGASAGLAEILAIHPVAFDWIQPDGRRHQGVIAQEIANVLPDLVYDAGIAGDEHLAVAYEELIPVLIRAIQEQQARIDQLHATIGGQ